MWIVLLCSFAIVHAQVDVFLHVGDTAADCTLDKALFKRSTEFVLDSCEFDERTNRYYQWTCMEAAEGVTPGLYVKNCTATDTTCSCESVKTGCENGGEFDLGGAVVNVRSRFTCMHDADSTDPVPPVAGEVVESRSCGGDDTNSVAKFYTENCLNSARLACDGTEVVANLCGAPYKIATVATVCECSSLGQFRCGSGDYESCDNSCPSTSSCPSSDNGANCPITCEDGFTSAGYTCNNGGWTNGAPCLESGSSTDASTSGTTSTTTSGTTTGSGNTTDSSTTGTTTSTTDGGNTTTTGGNATTTGGNTTSASSTGSMSTTSTTAATSATSATSGTSGSASSASSGSASSGSTSTTGTSAAGTQADTSAAAPLLAATVAVCVAVAAGLM